MKIKLNGIYRRRDGRVTAITKILPGPDYLYQDEIGNSYTGEGSYYADHRYDHQADLVFEISVNKPILGVESAGTIQWNKDIPQIFPIPEEHLLKISSAPVEVDSNLKASKHAQVIKAWADGVQCQYKGPEMDRWEDLLSPGKSMVMWKDNVEYRVKPYKLVKYFPLIKSFSGHVMFGAGQDDEPEGFPYQSNMLVHLATKRIVFDPDTFEILEETWEKP